MDTIRMCFKGLIRTRLSTVWKRKINTSSTRWLRSLTGHSSQASRKDRQHENVPAISEFYAGKNVFITGGTGFIGKSLIQKLFRSCPDVQGIYCLTRPKKGQDSQERLIHIFDDPIFDTLKSETPDQSFIKKLHAVPGDIVFDDFGLSDTMKDELFTKIGVFIHLAAQINFFDPMRRAVNMNVLGTRRATDLARRMSRLDAFVHVSTAFSNADRVWREVAETLYPMSISPEKLIQVCRDAPEDADDALYQLKGAFPNTYSFTKGVTEHMLMKEARDLPLCICRPSYVMPTWKDPLPGWTDEGAQKQGVTYVTNMLGRGHLRKKSVDRNIIGDLVPVDLTVNAMIASAWHTSVLPADEPRIYNITSTAINPLYWRVFENACSNTYAKYPIKKRVKEAAYNWMTPSGAALKFWRLKCHILPAYAKDLMKLLSGKKPSTRLRVSEMHQLLDSLEYFMTNPFDFKADVYKTLLNDMLPNDKQEFWCDPSEIDWDIMVHRYIMGIKRYIEHEDIPDQLMKAPLLNHVDKFTTP